MEKHSPQHLYDMYYGDDDEDEKSQRKKVHYVQETS